MKKCVKCGRKYEDSTLICSVCDLYLIKDIAGETGSSNKETSYEREIYTPVKEEQETHTQIRKSGRRNRVVQVEENEDAAESVVRRPAGQTVFKSSDEDEIAPVYNEDTTKTPSRRRRSNRWIRNVLPIFRIAFPVLLIMIAVILIALNWNTIREFLRACIVGGIIGGCLLTFLSLRFGRFFNPDVVTVGLLGGAVLGCIFKYNLLGTTVELSELIDAMMPCVITCAGIWLMLRSVFRRN